MTKSQLIKQYAGEYLISLTEATKVVNSVFACVRTAVLVHGTVVIPGFGVFKKVHRKARTACLPTTTTKVTYPAKDVIKFKPFKGFSGRP
jgi:DNA-binding protein HU-beta